MALAKAADIMSAYLKCAEELNAGNVEFKKAYDGNEKKLNELNLKRSRLVYRAFRRKL